MNRQRTRVEKLETFMVKPTPVESLILSSLAPDFEQRLAEAQEAGMFVVVLRPLTPLPNMEEEQNVET